MTLLACFSTIDIDTRYLYELRIPPGVPLQLKPSDGEVESFEVRFFCFLSRITYHKIVSAFGTF